MEGSGLELFPVFAFAEVFFWAVAFLALVDLTRAGFPAAFFSGSDEPLTVDREFWFRAVLFFFGTRLVSLKCLFALLCAKRFASRFSSVFCARAAFG
jgi:hypothetical protein